MHSACSSSIPSVGDDRFRRVIYMGRIIRRQGRDACAIHVGGGNASALENFALSFIGEIFHTICTELQVILRFATLHAPVQCDRQLGTDQWLWLMRWNDADSGIRGFRYAISIPWGDMSTTLLEKQEDS